MPGAAFASADRVTLRTIEDHDVPFLRDYANDPRIRLPVTFDGPTNANQQGRWVPEPGTDDAHFLACLEGGDVGVQPAYVQRGEDAPAGVDAVEPVGFVTVYHVNEREGNATVAYWLAPGAHGNGYSTEAVALAVDYAFTERRMHRVKAEVLATNTESIGLLEKLGFEREGVERDDKFVDGDYVDKALYGILEDEWVDVRETLDVDLRKPA